MKHLFSNKKLILSILAVVIILPALLVGTYLSGIGYGISQTKNIRIEGLSNAQTPDNISTDFNTFWEAWSELKSKQINGRDIKDQTLLEGAIKGLAGAYDDPYTVYFNPEDSQKFNDDVRGAFGGVGMEIGLKDGELIIVAPLKDTPAERAGLQPKDWILKIDSKDTTGMTVEDAVGLIRGEVGAKIVLNIYREGWREPKDIEIIRSIIKIPTLDYEIRNVAAAGNPTKNILYVQLYNFNVYAENLFAKAVDDGLKNNIHGVVMDLRSNPGGYLDVAINMAGWFIKRGDTVVVQKFAAGPDRTSVAHGNAKLLNIPVVVLINSGSASASEILAGALRDNRNAKLVGDKSFGKGSVQEINELSDGSTLKITIAHWLTPKGNLIDKNGLEPDYKVKITDDDFKNGKDPQLEKAMQILNGLLLAS